MKKRNKIISVSILFATLLGTTIISSNNNNLNKDNSLNNAVNVDEPVITVRDISDYLETKEEHYPFSDEFIEKYQQKDGGYITNAKKAGLTVDKRLHEPNQKWHYFDSWLYATIDEGMSWDEKAETRVYTNLSCPELILWIYEACEVSPTKVKNAKEVAEKGRQANTNVKTLASQMRKEVPFSDLKPAILDFMKRNDTSYFVNYESSEDYSISGLKSEYKSGSLVSFTINVLNKNKYVSEVKANNEIVKFEDNIYSFSMPRENVTLTVTLKDKIPATGVTLSSENIVMTVGEKNKVLAATITPNDSTDNITWSVEQNEEIIKISPNGNEVKINALKEGEAIIKATINEKIYANCSVFVNPKDPSYNENTQAKYNIEYDLGTRTTAKKLESEADIFATFKEETDTNLITSVDEFNLIYGGGNGGSGNSKWYSGNLLKIGTTSVNGDLTLKLEQEINKVIITGYIHHESCSIRIGDSSSSIWSDSSSDDNLTKLVSCSEMNLANLDNITNSNVSSIEIDIEATDTLKIATTSKKPLYISSIEFIYN